MLTALRILLVVIAVVGAYRELHVAWFYFARLRRSRRPFRGLRLVISNRQPSPTKGRPHATDYDHCA